MKIRYSIFVLLIIFSDSISQQVLIGNIESKFIHKQTLNNSLTNHLPDLSKQIKITNIDSSLKMGWTKCPICFKKPNISIRDYLFERQLGIEVAAQLRYYFQVSFDKEMTDKLVLIGNRVLKNWTFPLKGYSYDFKILESEEVNAFACPTGFIFVTSGLLEVAESDKELEAILAHEITHVENRHGYRLYKQTQDISILSTLASILLSGISNVDLSSLTEFSKNLILNGYSRKFEKEADTFATLYLEKTQNRSNEYLAIILKKFQDIHGRIGGFFSTHPKIVERVQEVENTKLFKIVSPKLVGYSKLKDIKSVSLEFHFGTLDRDDITLYGLIKKDAEILNKFEKNNRFKNVILRDDKASINWKISYLSYEEFRDELSNPISISMDVTDFKKERSHFVFTENKQLDLSKIDKVEIIFIDYVPYLRGYKLEIIQQ